MWELWIQTTKNEAYEVLHHYEKNIAHEMPSKLHDLERSFLKTFGILLHLTAFYLPLLDALLALQTPMERLV